MKNMKNHLSEYEILLNIIRGFAHELRTHIQDKPKTKFFPSSYIMRKKHLETLVTKAKANAKNYKAENPEYFI